MFLPVLPGQTANPVNHSMRKVCICASHRSQFYMQGSITLLLVTDEKCLETKAKQQLVETDGCKRRCTSSQAVSSVSSIAAVTSRVSRQRNATDCHSTDPVTKMPDRRHHQALLDVDHCHSPSTARPLASLTAKYHPNIATHVSRDQQTSSADNPDAP